eukprot:3763281-Ditylum_brightwellii.AAC.1
MKRATITQQQLLRAVGLAISIIVVFLVVWTTVDPSTRVTELVLVSKREGLVEMRQMCDSSSTAWKATAFAWEAFFVIIATILAFDSRR